MVNTGRRLPATIQQAVITHIAAGKRNYKVAAATGVFHYTIAKLRLSLEY